MSSGFFIGMALLAAGIVGADQLLKLLVLQSLRPIGTVSAIPGLLDWMYVENRGAAFSILQNQRWFFIAITVVLVGACVWYLVKECKSKWLGIALTLVIGGGIGNLIDRIFRGFVVDFISVSFFPPVFNFADICVVVGGIALLLMILAEIIHEEKQKKQLNETDTDDGRKNDL